MTSACKVGSGISAAGLSVTVSSVYYKVNSHFRVTITNPMQATLTILGISARCSS